MPELSRRVLERLMRYYLYLTAGKARRNGRSITSAQIGDALEIDATQVRKDLGAIGVLGLGRVGFDVGEVCRRIREVLGFEQRHDAVLIGAGHLGTALLAYEGFRTYGLNIVATFDSDPAKIGTESAGQVIRSVRALTAFIRSHRILLAIITTPAEAAQPIADRVVAAGVRAIWNLSPTELSVPRDVLVRNEHISLGLSVLFYRLKQ